MKTKAAEGRYLLVIVCAMLAILPRESYHDKTRFQCSDTMCKIYELMAAWDDQSPQVCRVLVQRFLLLYAELRREASSLGNYVLWRLYPKHHLWGHMDLKQSPRLEWNYPLENEIGKAAQLAGKCNVLHLHRCFLQRYVDTYKGEA